MMNLSAKKIMLLATYSLIFMASIVQAQVKQTDTRDINICYENLSEAYVSLNASQMVNVYADGGHYLSAGSKQGIIKGKPALSRLYNAYFGRLKKHNSSLDLQFRVSDRLVDEKSISDIGYYVVTIIPPKESGQPAKQHAGKFMITFKVQDNGQWGIWSEANSKAKVERYIEAQRQGNLHYDPYYPVSHYQQAKK